MTQIKAYKGIDLIEKILEFIEMTPNENEWNSKSLRDNKPRLIRFQQINSLLNAFSLQSNNKTKLRSFLFPNHKNEITTILNGDFIKEKKLEEFNELLDFAEIFLKKQNFTIKSPISHSELSFIYPKLIDYKIKLREIINFNSGWLESSTTFTIFHIFLTNSISSNLKNKYDDLDNTIELFINPRHLIFTEQELIEKYNFPTDNLDEIDFENY